MATNNVRKKLPAKALPAAPQRALPVPSIKKTKRRSQTVSPTSAPQFSSSRNANGATSTKFTYTFSPPTATLNHSHSTPMYTSTYYYSDAGDTNSGAAAAATTTNTHPWTQNTSNTSVPATHAQTTTTTTTTTTTQPDNANNNSNANDASTGFTIYSTSNGSNGSQITTHYSYTIGGGDGQPQPQSQQQNHVRRRSHTLPSQTSAPTIPHFQAVNSYRKALPLAPTTQNSDTEYAYGDHVDLNDNREGTVRFIGEIAVELQGDIWYGIELDDARGDNNGSLKRVQYFKCADSFGTFVQKRRVRWLSTNDAQIDEDKEDADAQIEEDEERWHINQTVKVRNKRGKAQIRFIGLYQDELRYGVELLDDMGVHSGHIDGRFYFTCGILRGLFVAPSDLSSVDDSKAEENASSKPSELSHALLARNGDEDSDDSDASNESDTESIASNATLLTVDDEAFERVQLNEEETDMAFAQIFNKYKNMEAAQPMPNDTQHVDAPLGVLQQIAKQDSMLDDTRDAKLDPSTSQTSAIEDSSSPHSHSHSDADVMDAGCTLDDDEQGEPRHQDDKTDMHADDNDMHEVEPPPSRGPRAFSIVVSEPEAVHKPESDGGPDSHAEHMPTIAEQSSGTAVAAEDETAEFVAVHGDAELYDYDPLAGGGHQLMQEPKHETAPMLGQIETIPSQKMLPLKRASTLLFGPSPFTSSHSPQASVMVDEHWFEQMAHETHLKEEPESPFDVNTSEKQFANTAQLILLGCNNPHKLFKVLKGLSIKLYHSDMEYRVIDTQSQRIRVKLLNYDGAEEFLNKLGFKRKGGAEDAKLECALDQPPACVLEAAINVCNEFISKCSRDRAVIDMIKNFGNTLNTPLSGGSSGGSSSGHARGATQATSTRTLRVHGGIAKSNTLRLETPLSVPIGGHARGASAMQSRTRATSNTLTADVAETRERGSSQPTTIATTAIVNEEEVEVEDPPASLATTASVGLPPPHDWDNDDDDDQEEEQKSVMPLNTEPAAEPVHAVDADPAAEMPDDMLGHELNRRQSSFGEQVEYIENDMHHMFEVEQHEIEEAVDELFGQANEASETTDASTAADTAATTTTCTAEQEEAMEDDELEGNDDTFQLYHIISVITHEENVDNSARQILLLTYPTFASAEQIWDCLDRRFFECDVCADDDEHEQQGEMANFTWRVQSKVTAFIKIWIKQYWDGDWHSNVLLLAKLKTWLEKMDAFYAQRSHYSRYKKLIEMLSTTVEIQRSLDHRKLSLIQTSSASSPTPMLVSSPQSGAQPFDSSYDFFKLKNTALARQLTAIDMQLFAAIQPRECLGQAWKKENKYEIARNICNLIDHCNHVARWVQSRILLARTAKIRGRLIKKFVKICEQLFVLRNFSSLFAVQGALNSTPIIRLKKAWHYVPTKHLAKFEEFKVIFASKKNNANLRRLHRETNPPMMPYIGLYLQDLFNVEEGNTKRGQDGSVNFARLIRLSTVIDSLLVYQSTTYKISVDKQLQLLLSTELSLNQHLDDDFLWNLSKAATQIDNKKSNFISFQPQSSRKLVF